MSNRKIKVEVVNENTNSDKKIVLDVFQDQEGNYRTMLPEARFVGGSHKADASIAPMPEEEHEGVDWAPWGENDCFPTDVRKKIEQVPMANTTVYKLIAMMYGNGLAYYRNGELKDGETKIKRAFIPEIESWLKKNKINSKWLMPQFADYRYYMNCFSEMVLNKKRDFITGLFHKQAEYCRLEKQNGRNLKIEGLYYSADFIHGHQPGKKRRIRIPLYDWHDEEQFFKKLKKFKFAYHSRFETPGVTYYARPFWVGLFRDKGWIEASISVPEIVNSMMKNQVILKYQILIPESYFQIRYQDWDTYSDEQRNTHIDKLIKEINDTLSGTKNAYKSITTVFRNLHMMGSLLEKLKSLQLMIS